jgi:hypothetical protein
VANTSLAAICFMGLGLWSRSPHRMRRPIAYLCLLSMIPVISPLGWAYVYVMALPALLVALVRDAPRALVTEGLLLGACLAFFVPESHVFGFAARLPDSLQNLLYSRYALAAAVVCGLLVRSIPAEQAPTATAAAPR